MHAKLLAPLALGLMILAGCSSPDPTGKLADLSFQTPLEGGAAITYQPFNNGGSPFPSTLPVNATCAQDNPTLPPDPSGNIKRCKGPYTNIVVSAPNLFDPAGGTYKAFLTGPGQPRFEIGTLAASGTNWTVAKNETRDLSGKYDKVELMLDGFLYGVASAGTGQAPISGASVASTFTLAPGVNGLTVAGTYSANTLTVTVSGLPSNATYMGNLYLNGPDGNVLATPAETFPIPADGVYEYSGKGHQISEFSQFHIHVGMSKLNLYKASIKPDA